MPRQLASLTAIALLFLSGCSRDVEYYQKHTDEAQTKLGECLKMDDPRQDEECVAAAEALKQSLENSVNNLMNLVQ